METTAFVTGTGDTDRIFRFIADAGATTAAELARHLGIDRFRADVWLLSQAARGYLSRQSGGAFATSCAWPRQG